MDKMKGLCLNEEQKLELRMFDVPEPTFNQVRVKVKRVGICASDLSYWKHGSDRLKLPVILGHEISGVVDKIGSQVSGVKEGERVIVTTTYHVCGVCKYCQAGRTNLCIERKGLGSKQNGGMAEYVVVPATSIIKLPKTMSFEEGAMVEPLACGVHGMLELSKVYPDDVVLVIGPGAIGMLAAQVAKSAGATVIVTGLTQDAKRLAVAKEIGIDRVVDLQKEDLKAVVMEMTEGYGADCVVEASGAYPALGTALDLVAKGKNIVDLGYYHGPCNLDMSIVMLKEVNLIGSLSQKPTAWETSKNLIRDKKVIIDKLVSNIFEIEDYQKAFEIAADISGFKVLFKFD